MAGGRKPSTGERARSPRSGGAKKRGAKAPAANGTSNGAGRTAAAARAEAAQPALEKPRRGGSFARWFSVAALLTGVVLVIILIASGGDDDGNNATVADTIPTINTAPPAPAAQPAPETTPTITAPPVTAPAVKKPAVKAPAATPPVAPKASQAAHRTVNCDPIIGSGSLNGGRTYPVNSAASSGRPAGCAEAHSVLLSALSSGRTTVSGWTCRTDTSGDPIAVCHTGGRTITARG